MLCQKCGNKPAIMKLDEVVNNEKKTCYICEDCATELMNSHLSFGGFDPFAAFSGFLREHSRGVSSETVCPSCGLTLRRFLDEGKFGCAQCYEAFGERLEPIMKKLQPSTEYKGRRPAESGFATVRPQTEKSPGDEKAITFAELERAMKEAAAREDYEEAARCKKQLEEMRKGEEHE